MHVVFLHKLPKTNQNTSSVLLHNQGGSIRVDGAINLGGSSVALPPKRGGGWWSLFHFFIGKLGQASLLMVSLSNKLFREIFVVECVVFKLKEGMICFISCLPPGVVEEQHLLLGCQVERARFKGKPRA